MGKNMMKITSTMLSIPPYLSTTWKNISSLHVQGQILVILLKDGTQVDIPHLDQESIKEIFEAHVRSTEETFPPFSFKIPFKEGGGLDTFNHSMQHNPLDAETPPLPPEMLNKIAAIARAFGLEDTALPKAEPHCNCPYCQVARAIHNEAAPEEEIVSEAELQFRDWQIQQQADKLYTVTNPLDANEQYNVFLGEPLGCTCGSKNCEHIRAVLNS
jgi:hypothetical protein